VLLLLARPRPPTPRRTRTNPPRPSRPPLALPHQVDERRERINTQHYPGADGVSRDPRVSDHNGYGNGVAAHAAASMRSSSYHQVDDVRRERTSTQHYPGADGAHASRDPRVSGNSGRGNDVAAQRSYSPPHQVDEWRERTDTQHYPGYSRSPPRQVNERRERTSTQHYPGADDVHVSRDQYVSDNSGLGDGVAAQRSYSAGIAAHAAPPSHAAPPPDHHARTDVRRTQALPRPGVASEHYPSRAPELHREQTTPQPLVVSQHHVSHEQALAHAHAQRSLSIRDAEARSQRTPSAMPDGQSGMWVHPSQLSTLTPVAVALAANSGNGGQSMHPSQMSTLTPAALAAKQVGASCPAWHGAPRGMANEPSRGVHTGGQEHA
jgi:hypothetical protein